MPDISCQALQDLSQREFEQLSGELLASEGVAVEELAQSGATQRGQHTVWIAPVSNHRTLVVASKSGQTPLATISLPSLARRARTAGASHLEIFITAPIDADQEASYAGLFSQLRDGAGVTTTIVDGVALLERIAKFPDLALKWFPTRQDAEATAREHDFPRPLTALLTSAPETSSQEDGHDRPEYLRLAWTAGGVVLLIWLPLALQPYSARWVAAIGLGIIIVGVISAQAFRPDRDAQPHVGDSVMGLVLPVRSRRSFQREIQQSTDWRPIAMDYAKRLPGYLVYAATRTALFLFLLTCALIYLLVWSFDAESCRAAAGCSGAFAGVGQTAHVGEFMNLAVQAAFFNLPADVQPASGVARGLVDAEFVLSAVLLGSYAAFFGFTRLGRPTAR